MEVIEAPPPNSWLSQKKKKKKKKKCAKQVQLPRHLELMSWNCLNVKMETTSSLDQVPSHLRGQNAPPQNEKH